ncbi:Separin [Araneus ventricosus]|uniref:separase n=1 Tax=Araneus ventricosus TaxID=182803 RepID=A0A4Y2ER03_ARAVE|nr:Separin [Araneus ventricosus]
MLNRSDIQVSEAEASLKSRSEDEENETCDIKPAFPLVTFFVEAEVIKNLEMALEIWMGISQDLNCDWKELSEVINNWNILSIINTTAELFSTSAYDIYELRSWILLWTVASSIKNKEYCISSSVSLADFLLKCGYSDTAFQLLNLFENDSFLNESCTNQILLRLKLQLTKSKFYLQKAMFDEGLILLLDILQNPVFEKKLKHAKLLKVQCLMLQTEFLLVPICAFSDARNLEYFQIHTAISSAMECATLSAGLWKVTLDKQNSDSSNDGMSFKNLLLRNFLKAYLLLAEQYFVIGDPRFARCYLKEGLKIAQGRILTFWASKMLIVLAKIDLLCHNPTDCLVKLDGLKYIMDQDAKKNASILLSKINSKTRVSECVDESDDFIIPSGTNLNLRRGIKQNYIDSNVHASPISTKMENSKFEVKLESYGNGSMFSIFLLKLEIWALSCLHLVVEDKISFAKSQLKKLVQRCEILKKKNKSFVEALTAGKFELPVPSFRYSCKSEIKLLTSVFLELSLVYFSENDVKSSDDYLKRAFNSLSDSCEKENYAYPVDYALLNYHQIVITLKNDLNIASNDCLEYKICPSVKNKCVFSRQMIKSEKSAMNMNTPTKCPQISVTPCLTNRKLCHAPSKKDILPRHLKKDMEIMKSNSMKSLLFSSSDDDFSSGLKTPSPLKVTLKNTRVRKKPEKSSSSYLKPKNTEKSIEASCDIWKCHTLFSPEASKENKKNLACEVKSRNLRQNRLKNRSIISDSSRLQIPNSTKTSKRNKTAKSNLKNTECVANNSSECCDLISGTSSTERISVESNRCSSKNRLKYDDSPKNDDVFYSDCPEVISKEDSNFSTGELSLEYSHPIVDELCKNLNSMDISLQKSLNISVDRLTECIEKLKLIRSLVEHIAPYPLYANICRILAVLLIADNKTQPRNSDSAFMLSETFSSTLRQIHLSNVLFYKDKLINGDRNCILETLRRNNQPVGIQMDNILQTIPKDYTIVQINAIPDEEFKLTSNSKFKASKLIVCRYQHNMKPIVMCINSSSDEMFNSKLFPNFEKILLESTLIMKQNDDTKKWWKTRSTLDSNLKSMVEDMEDRWFGCWKGLLLSKCENEDRLSQLMKIRDSLPKTAVSSDENFLVILLDSAPYLSRNQLSAAVCHLWNCSPLDEVYSKVYKSISELSTGLPISKRHPLILILDKNIQALPWESLPLLKDVPVSRIPSLSILMSLCTTLVPLSYKEVDCNDTFYVLNPSGDLKYSEEYFKHRFEKQANWKGITGRAPVSQEFSSAFKCHDLFVYCGHGSGRQYLEGISIDTMKCRAATILMGCSSGRLKQLSRQLEAYGIPLSYLMNGCPFVIGNLWDVTDKDIDRFTDKLLELFVPNYCQNQNSTTNIADAVRQARNACKMRYLVGAAPIMYGLPTIAKS